MISKTTIKGHLRPKRSDNSPTKNAPKELNKLVCRSTQTRGLTGKVRSK